MARLFDFQSKAVRELLTGKHFIISGTGCLAGDTPIPMAYGGYKAVRDLSSGEAILSYDENKKEFVVGEVDCVIRTCHKPKPMIQLEYDGEKITTTYDHPFFNGEGYYPLYQLIWGALETSQRVQLKLLCKQYGQTFDDKAIWCKHCGSNEACVGQQWVLQDNDGRQDGKSTSDSGRELAEEPYQLGLCKPFRLQQSKQQSGKPRVVFKKVQCLVGDKKWHDGEAHELEKRESPNTRRTGSDEKFLQQEYTVIEKQLREEEAIRQDVPDVSQVYTRENNVLGDWKVQVKVSEPYYTISMREAPYTYCIGRKHYFVTHNSGKTAMALVWAELMQKQTGKTKLLVVTTASKAKTGDFEEEAEVWAPSLSKSLSSFSVLSWHKLRAWVDANLGELGDYMVIFDECLPADTLVRTDKGEKELATLSVGDKVFSYNHEKKRTELKTITRTIKKKAPTTMYRLLLSNGTVIISTGNHPHWTQNGYVEAKDIKQGDTLYEMRDMWKNHRRDDVEEIPQGQIKSGEENILFERMWEKGDKRKWEKGDGKPRTERKIETKSSRANENEQPVAEQRTNGESITDEEKEWLASDMGVKPKLTGWQRKLFRTAKIAMEKTKRGEQGVGDGTTSVSRGMGTWVSQELQVRHRQFLPQNRDRVRWQQPQFPKGKSERQEEGEEIRGVRVESVEVLELGDIKRLGLYRDADNVYCIDVEDNHNFFANGILTHNCQKGSAGVSSGMGKAFLKITKKTDDWAAFTATPGDTWLKFYPYFVACNMVRNKTSFLNTYANVQTFKGYPEIIGWRMEDQLQDMWARISYAPDTSKVMNELPEQTHKVVKFKKPSGYNTILKTRVGQDGEFLDTTGALCAELRRVCFTKDKREWVKDFVEGLESGCVFFYNFIKTGDELEAIMQKALPKGAKVWRIDGKHHEIPTAETMGKHDVVLCQWQSGSEGINLQYLNYMVIVEANYSYTLSIQGRGRIRRIGQKKPQFYFYLKTEGTIEDAIYEALRTKSDFAEDKWCMREGMSNGTN